MAADHRREEEDRRHGRAMRFEPAEVAAPVLFAPLRRRALALRGKIRLVAGCSVLGTLPVVRGVVESPVLVVLHEAAIAATG
jgi:hypothetical protein